MKLLSFKVVLTWNIFVFISDCDSFIMYKAMNKWPVQLFQMQDLLHILMNILHHVHKLRYVSTLVYMGECGLVCKKRFISTVYLPFSHTSGVHVCSRFLCIRDKLHFFKPFSKQEHFDMWKRTITCKTPVFLQHASACNMRRFKL